MRAALVIAAKDLRQRLRDRSAILVSFVAPFVLAVIVSAAFGSGFTDNFHVTFAVVDQDASQFSKTFVDRVLGAKQFRDQIEVRRTTGVDQARKLIEQDEVSAAFVIPKGFGTDVTAGRNAKMTVLANPDSQVGSQIAEAFAQGYADQINATRLSVLTAMRARGGPPDPTKIAQLARAAAAERIPVRVTDAPIGVREISGANYFGPSMAIFFLFFTTGFAARSLLAERQAGTMPRIVASPIHAWSLVGGKAIAGLCLGVTSVAVMFVSLGLLFGVQWGDPTAVVVLSLVTVLAVLGLTAVVQLVAKTQEQADAYSSIVAVSLALLGGNFFPQFQLPSVIQRLSLITPNGWALRGFSDISYDGATLADLGPHIAVIAAFAAVTGGIALFQARRLSPT
jgi:ABC-2 type transport system permease protein